MTADFEARRRLRYASSLSLIVRRTRLSTIGDRAFPVTARAGFNWWEAWGSVYLGGTGRLQQLYD